MLVPQFSSSPPPPSSPPTYCHYYHSQWWEFRSLPETVEINYSFFFLIGLFCNSYLSDEQLWICNNVYHCAISVESEKLPQFARIVLFLNDVSCEGWRNQVERVDEVKFFFQYMKFLELQGEGSSVKFD